LPAANIPVSKKTACGRSIVLGSLAISGSHGAKPEWTSEKPLKIYEKSLKAKFRVFDSCAVG
jgi:hypothetical protein